MMMKRVTLIICGIIVLFVGLSFAQTTIRLGGVIRDQAPREMFDCGGTPGTANNSNGFWNTDFQIKSDSYTEYEKGLCGAECNSTNYQRRCGRLGSDQTPVYAYNGTSPGNNIRSPASFKHWFHTTNQTYQISHEITLTLSRNNVYTYSNDSFFPIDNMGWRDYCYDGNGSGKKKHNYAFCLEAHTRFGYRGGEVFSFSGDDDVWVYINDYLVIDLGSLHPKASKSVSLDTLPFISVGNNYRLDFFYCERHTTASNLMLSTSLTFYCAYEDWCGICEGNGQSCCTGQALQTCNDNNACTVDTCGILTAPGTAGGCVNTPINCTAPDMCSVATCDRVNGCVVTSLDCDDHDLCTNQWCDPRAGCQYSRVVCNDNSNCTTDTCVSPTGCQFTPKVCNDSNACTIDTCNNSTGCVFTERPPCNDNSKCTRDTCDPAVGCVFTYLCDDGNRCTNDTCNPAVGCSSIPINCTTGNRCMNDTCNLSTGRCGSVPIVCPDRDLCTLTSCSNSSGCAYTPKNCEDGDQCTINTCSLTLGCTNTTRVCNDSNACTTDSCNRATGCVFSNVTINDNNACTADSCDPITGVHHDPIICDDHDECTVNSCSNTTGCQYITRNCDDGNPCTIDTCNSATGCLHQNIPGCVGCVSGPSGTGSPINCTTTDKCFPIVCDIANGGCKNGTAVNCSDNNACTTDTCFDGRCSNTDIVCTPPNACTIASCDRARGCVYTNKSCEDFNPCTLDTCLASGTCSSTPLAPFCVSCGLLPCTWSDPCKPKVCNATTQQCQEVPVVCDDQNACTIDQCDGRTGVAVCNTTILQCPSSGDVCSPNICDPAVGCKLNPVRCNDNNKCTNDTCVDVGSVPTCQYNDVPCAYTDLCLPKVCNATDGGCYVTPVVCNDNDLCTVDTCVTENNRAVCRYTPVSCPNDECGPMKCDGATGTCKSAPLDCNDFNPCTNDTRSCNGTATVCTYFLNGICEDNDACTNDRCDSFNQTAPCSHSPVVCAPPTVCEDFLECHRVNGCIFVPKKCPGQGDVCKLSSCDPRVGCILEDRVCTVDDPGCYTPVCDSNSKENPCTKKALPDWAFRTSVNGILCSLRYDPTARNAAIGTGAAIGIAIGGAAAAALIGYGGKKGYDFINAMREQRFNGVQNNPLYEQTNAASDNPLYRYSTTVN